MNKEQKNIFIKKLKEGIEVNKNIFNSIAHDELQLGYVIHTELYNNIIDLVEEWCTDNAIDPDSIWELYDAEDIFWEL